MGSKSKEKFLTDFMIEEVDMGPLTGKGETERLRQRKVRSLLISKALEEAEGGGDQGLQKRGPPLTGRGVLRLGV